MVAEIRQRIDTKAHAVVGSFKQGRGELFTAGCADWAYGLLRKDVATITNNALEHFIHDSGNS
jgi:hypothetical protein